MAARSSSLAALLLAVSGPVLADCTGDWAAPAAETMARGDGTEFRITRFANLETRVSVARPEGPFDLLLMRGAVLVKGIGQAELPGFVRDAFWWTVYGAPASNVVWQVVRGDPCKVAGRFDIDVAPLPQGASHRPELKLLRARGQAVADGQGLIRYAIRFDTEPALPPDRPLTYAGTLSFVKQGEALPDDLDVGGFDVIPRDKPGFVAPPGTTLSALRARFAIEK
jgi:hypothetical protein